MNNGRFATSIHIMTLLAHHQDQLLSSDYIAASININAAIVRKEISNLARFGLIESKEGKGGGSSLAKNAKSIKLADIYQAVLKSPLLGRNNDPNPACNVGKQINKQLDLLSAEVEKAMIRKLNKITLFDFAKRFV